MINKARTRQILTIGWPVIMGMLSVNLLVVVDTIMLGRLGAYALTSVGVGGVLYGLALTFIAGISPAVQSMTGWRVGAGDTEKQLNPMYVGIITSVIIGIPLIFIVKEITFWAVSFYSQDPFVVKGSGDYLRIAIFGIIGVGINSAFRGFWNGLGKTKIYMFVIMVMHVVNITFNFLLIFGYGGFPRMGIRGAAVASVISIYTGSVCYLLTLFVGKNTKWPRPHWDWGDFKIMLKLSWPLNIRGLISSAAMVLVFRMVSVLGDNVLAAMTVLGRLTQILTLPAGGFGMATATLVSHAVGRKDLEDAEQWGWDGVYLGAMILFAVGLPFALFPTPILHLFIAETEVVAIARAPLILTGLTTFLGFGWIILPQALFGAGDNLRVTIVGTILEWALLLPGIYLVTTYLELNLFAVSSVYVCHSLVSAIIFVIIWKRGRWKLLRR